MRLLRHYREVLHRDIASLDTAALDWRPHRESVTIGTSLLHIAAVEYLVVSAVAIARRDLEQPPDRELWDALKPGLARELGEEQCVGRALPHYTALLERSRRPTEAVLSGPWTPVDMTAGLAAVFVALAIDPADQPALRAPLGLPFAVAGGQRGEDLALALAAHESYHRGQITQANFLRRRAISESGA